MEELDSLIERFVDFYGRMLIAESINIKKIGLRQDKELQYIYIPKPKKSKSDIKVYVEIVEDKYKLSVLTNKKIPKELPEYYKQEIVEKTKTTKNTKITRICTNKSFPGELERMISVWIWIEYVNRD